MTDTPATPSTATFTSLRNRPTLRLVLQGAWVLVVAYIAWILSNHVLASVGGSFTSVYFLSQIARIGLSLLTYSTVQLLADFYILLGFFSLAMLLFIRRSDDWMAIFLPT